MGGGLYTGGCGLGICFFMDDINVSKPGKRESFAFVESVPIGVTENRDKVKGYNNMFSFFSICNF